LLKNSRREKQPEKPDPSWRTNGKHFIEKSDRHVCEPGAVNFSAGWFGLGHAVGIYFPLILTIESIPNQSEEYPLKPSLNLRTQLHLGPHWIKLSNEVERFLNLTLSLTHPNLFESGILMLQSLRELETTKEVAEEWQSVYTGISVISNRVTPPHRDSRGRPEWFDTLMSYSDPRATPRLLIEDIGLDLEYHSGTVVSFCGTVLKHGVESWGDGDRVCYAHFMREEVRKRLDAPPAGWVHRNMYHSGFNMEGEESSGNPMDVD
jgi:hypothetical protein